MGLPRAQHLIVGIQKKDPRLFQLLEIFSVELDRVQKVVAKLAIQSNQTIGGRTDGSFAAVEKFLATMQKIAGKPNPNNGLGGGIGTNLLKRLSVRI